MLEKLTPDIAAFHGYGYTADPEDIQNGVKYVKATLAQYGMASAELWNTEASWGDASLSSEDDRASWMIRYQIVQAFSGVSRFTWYAYDNCQWGTLRAGALCPASAAAGIREAAVAYATVERWLTGATLQSCETHADGTWICKMTRDNGYVAWAAWNSKHETSTLMSSEMPGVVQYRDWQNQKNLIAGNVEVGAMPILLENQDGYKTNGSTKKQ
jgi:hypothetical protein